MTGPRLTPKPSREMFPYNGLSGPAFQACRLRAQLSPADFGRALGYQGDDNVVGVQIRRYESGRRPIPAWVARLAVMFGRYGVPLDLP